MDINLRQFNLTDLETRSDDNSMNVSGYAVLFDSPSLNIPFVEEIRSTAFDGVNMDDVLLLFNHDTQNVLARTSANSLSLSKDERGLKFEATMPDTTVGRDTFTNIKNGNLRGCSFGFTVKKDSWKKGENGKAIRSIDQIGQLTEISIVALPAYPNTSVEIKRSLDEIMKEGAKILEAQEPKEEVKVEEPKKEEVRSTEPVKVVEEKQQPTPEPKEEKREQPMPTAQVEEVRDLKAAEPFEIRNFKNYLQTGKLEKRDGFTTTNGEPFIPTQILNALAQPKDPSQLSSYVNRVSVQAPSGCMPILKKAKARLVTADELAESPTIANAVIGKVNYDCETYRGQLPISMEMTQDYSGMVGLLSQYVTDVQNQTEQEKIGAILQKATPVSAKSMDDLKDAYNIGLSNYGSDRMWVVTETMYSQLDKMTDKNGRYLLNDNVTTATGRSLFGANLIIVADDVLGGGAKAFVGSLKAFVLETVRSNLSVKWVENAYFETVLGVALRADFQVADTEAGKFITFGGATTSAK